MNVPSLNLQIMHDASNPQSTRAQSVTFRKSIHSQRATSSIAYPALNQPIQQSHHNQQGTIKQLFNRPTEAIVQKLNQRRIGLSEDIIKNPFDNNTYFSRQNTVKNDKSTDYSIEISKNHIFPSLDSPHLQLILEKSSQQRTIKELHFIKECLGQLEIFKSWHDNQVLATSINQSIEQQCEDEYQSLLIYKYLMYRSYNKYSPLFQQDDKPKECYTIIKGEALALQREITKKENQSEILIAQLLLQHDLSQEEFDKINELYPNYTIVGRIKQGRLFGENGLLFQEPRTITVISITDEMSVGCLDPKSFKITIQAQITRQNEKILQFLGQISLFKGIPDSLLINLAKSCDLIERKINTYLYKENDSIDYVYFIMNGEVEITQLIQRKNEMRSLTARKDRSQDDSYRSLDRSNIIQQFNSSDIYQDEGDLVADVKECIVLNKHYKPQTGNIQNSRRKGKNQAEEHIKQLQQLAEQRQYDFLHSKKNNNQTISTILGRFEIFGDQLDNCEKRTNTAKVISASVKLIRIKSTLFFDMIVNSFSKHYPQIDIIKQLYIKTQKTYIFINSVINSEQIK